MHLNLVADRVVKGRIYPALARHQAVPYTQGWREFGQHTVTIMMSNLTSRTLILSGQLMHFILWVWVSLTLALITLN